MFVMLMQMLIMILMMIIKEDHDCLPKFLRRSQQGGVERGPHF